MCCKRKERDENQTVMLDKSTFTNLQDEELTKFGEHWNEFETENTLKSFVIIFLTCTPVCYRFKCKIKKILQESVCEFLSTTDQTGDDCIIAVTLDGRVRN